MMTADQLAEEGRQLSEAGLWIMILMPWQEWMAVACQLPFLRVPMKVGT